MTDFSADANPQPNEALRHIYDLILNDQQSGALEQLRAYLDQHPNDAEAWWLVANAVPDIPSARVALQSVLRIDPNHQQAKDLLGQLDAAVSEQFVGSDPFSSPNMAEAIAAPDWLNQLSSKVTGSTPAATPAADVPDWLKSMGGNAASLTPDDLMEPPPDDLLNWFTAPSEPEPESAATAPAAAITPASDMPDWLKAAEPTADQPADSAVSSALEGWGAPPEDLLGETSNDTLPMAPSNVPDWLKAAAPTPEDSMVSEAQTAEPVASAMPDDLSSWFSTPPELADAPAAETPAEPVTSAAPDDLSGWLGAAQPWSDSTVEAMSANPKPTDPMPDWLESIIPTESPAENVPEPVASTTSDELAGWFGADQTWTDSTAEGVKDAPIEPALTPVPAGSEHDSTVDDLLNWLDNPTDKTAEPAAAIATPETSTPEPVMESGTAQPANDLASWFDVPADLATEPGGEPVTASTGEAAAVPASSLPDWLQQAAPTPESQLPPDTIPVEPIEPIAEPAESTVVSQPVAATVEPAAETQPIEPTRTPAIESPIPEMASLNAAVENAALPNWMTSDEGTGKARPQDAGPVTIEPDTVPSFIQEGKAVPSTQPFGTTPRRDFSVAEEEAVLDAGVSTKEAVAATATTSAKMTTQPPAPIQREPERNTRTPLLVIIALLVIVALIAILAPRFIQAPPVTGTAVAVAPTQATTVPATQVTVATAAVTVPVAIPTMAASAPVVAATPSTAATAIVSSANTGTPASLNDVIAALPAQLTALGIPKSTAAIKDSSLGKALTVSFCQPYGPNLQKNAYSAMDALAAQVAGFAGQAQAIGVEIHGCGASAPVEYRAVVLVSDAVAYVNKQIDAHQFRAGWKSS